MACSNRNLVVNGEFRRGISPWTGHDIKWVKNPLRYHDTAVLMNPSSNVGIAVLKQTVSGTFEQGCAYYLYLRVMNVSPSVRKVLLFATVAYLDAGKGIIRSTPLVIEPPRTGGKWFSYFSIVPPPPPRARFMTVSFFLKEGALLIDTVRLASHEI
jgi:hypothetical protein